MTNLSELKKELLEKVQSGKLSARNAFDQYQKEATNALPEELQEINKIDDK